MTVIMYFIVCMYVSLSNPVLRLKDLNKHLLLYLNRYGHLLNKKHFK